jgi:hypothetical protein
MNTILIICINLFDINYKLIFFIQIYNYILLHKSFSRDLLTLQLNGALKIKLLSCEKKG